MGRASELLATLLAVVVLFGGRAGAQQDSQDEILKRLEHLEKNQQRLYELLESKDERIEALESELERVKGAPPAPVAAPDVPPPAEPIAPPPVEAPQVVSEETVPAAEKFFGTYQPGRGFGLARNEYGELNFSLYTYVRYLNQDGLDDTYTDRSGQTVTLNTRDDVNVNKVMLYFKGWVVDPRFRYFFYTWTNNTSQGLGAQVVVGGNLTYAFHDALVLGAGISGLPTNRSNEGNFPFFLSVDHRTLADEFFKGSYTMGFFARGRVADGLIYSVMLGNNLSQLGVDAGQLDGDFTTVSGAMWWMPTTGEFGQGFGDYEQHENLATRFGLHFTFSPEDKQSQPDTEDPDNSQIRLSDGTIIFSEGALTPGVSVDQIDYYMTALDAGLKYQGFALEGEYFLRWLDDPKASGPLPVDDFFDHGFQLQTSMMLLPKTVQIYNQGSYVFGEYGDPWEVSAGLNWWVFRRRELRLNVEYLYNHRSPVGYFAIPQLVGGTGSIVHANVELFF